MVLGGGGIGVPPVVARLEPNGVVILPTLPVAILPGLVEIRPNPPRPGDAIFVLCLVDVDDDKYKRNAWAHNQRSECEFVVVL